ncbi:phage tail sheath C-terminal domain-containing protein [Clostridium saccharobutylicum]|uniref:Uncharacterized protein n=1 Tax=Clostridium saccharobutylicum DSM 13864 TaxID=1345695 RepID=U5MUZ2_CLOSA|nr:phage tail sheath C-terminal domain-containing protein [Clostridium saccharobutylicum]AGX43282.1 hypothetical protein CLSA_c23070 [Clostridium saccharobutylicum DSM 13864]AQR90582.1 phage tail sheath protein [Clostridium saccharobutylicum]AQS00486.1 phage tail sheath protein [Clostridium saccharobutylicum]AQS14469.1 phage tail sheath protein [Clostridium saccharobutylicum]MBA2906290.1 hypothetical protein [Clostridium saccharobutylicum]
MSDTRVSITLKALAENAKSRSSRGIVCLVLDEPNVVGLHTYSRLKAVNDNYSDANKAMITRCFSGHGVKLLRVVCYNSAANTPQTIETALTLLNNVKFNYLACPTANSDDKKMLIANFIKDQRKNNNILVKAVLNNYVGDYEGIINWINKKVAMSAGTVYTGLEYTVDVACDAATCSLESSLTNKVLEGVESVDDVGEDLDVLKDSGKFFAYYDNDLEAVVYYTAVNSKTTVGENEKASMKKIRVMDILDMMRDDQKVAFKTTYQGKVDNSYSNKKLLISAYNTYLRGLIKQGAISAGNALLDTDSIAQYVEKNKSIDTSGLKDEEINALDTDEEVFATETVGVLDAMEKLNLAINF